MKVEIKKVKLSEIKLNPNNPRRISEQAMNRLVKSVEEFSRMLELRPIVYDETGTILGGNMRYLALKKLGYTEIPETWARGVADLTEDEKRRFIIVDNADAFGEWDMDVLSSEWDSFPLIEWGIDLPKAWMELPEEKEPPPEEPEQPQIIICPKCKHEFSVLKERKE